MARTMKRERTLFIVAYLFADVEFLLPRANAANRYTVGERGCRATGISSNALVRAAYGGAVPSEEEFPSDMWDLAACLRAFAKLPKHRKTKLATDLKQDYERSIVKKFGEDALTKARMIADTGGLDP